MESFKQIPRVTCVYGKSTTTQQHNTSAFIITALQFIYANFNKQSVNLTAKDFSGTIKFSGTIQFS